MLYGPNSKIIVIHPEYILPRPTGVEKASNVFLNNY